MPDYIVDLLKQLAPLIAGFITSTLLPALISRWSVNRLGKKIDSIERSAIDRELLSEVKALKREVSELKEEVLILRGKRR